MMDPDYLRDIASMKRQPRGGDDADGIDKDYMDFLQKEFAIDIGNEGNTVPSNSAEEIRVDCYADKDDDDDPHYKLFLQNLRPCGTAYVLKVARRSINVIVKYEDKDEDEFQSPDERRRKTRSHARRNSPKPQRKNGLLREMKDLNIDRDQLQGDINSSRCEKAKTNRVRENNTKLASSSRRAAPKVAEVPCQKGKQKARSPCHDEKDKSYLWFLDHVKMVGGSPVYTDENGNKFRYEKSTDEGPSDSDTEGSARPPPSSGRRIQQRSDNKLVLFEKGAPKNKMAADEGSSAEFRDRVMEILKKPYDAQEYHDLCKEATVEKPITLYKEMRGGRSVAFADEENMAKSYLDNYRELRKKFTEARKHDDLHKALNLLRGLFFYLRCLCWQDSFVPWNDKEWLEALDRSTSKRLK